MIFYFNLNDISVTLVFPAYQLLLGCPSSLPDVDVSLDRSLPPHLPGRKDLFIVLYYAYIFFT